MSSRTALAALMKDVATLRERVASADLGPVPTFVIQEDGTFVSDDPAYANFPTLDDALAIVPDRGAFVARAVVVDQSAGLGDTDAYGNVLDGYDDDLHDTAPVLTIVRPPRRVSWDAVYPVPGIKPGRDDISGRPWFGWHGGRMIFGITVDGERVGLDANGPYVLESET